MQLHQQETQDNEDEVVPVDEEEWARTVQEIAAQSARQFIQQGSMMHELTDQMRRDLGQSHGLLINVESTRLIEDEETEEREEAQHQNQSTNNNTRS